MGGPAGHEGDAIKATLWDGDPDRERPVPRFSFSFLLPRAQAAWSSEETQQP